LQAQQAAANAVQQARQALGQNGNGQQQGNPQNLQQGIAQAQQNINQVRTQQSQQADQIRPLTPGATSQQQARQLAPQQQNLADNTRNLANQLQQLANANRQQNPNAANQLRSAANQLNTNQTALRLERAGEALEIAGGPEGTSDQNLQNRAYEFARERQQEVAPQLRDVQNALNQAGQAAGQPQERQQVQHALNPAGPLASSLQSMREAYNQ